MPSQKTDLKFLFFVTLLGLALRLDFLIANNFVIDADEGIVGIMALHITQGYDIPVFYYGQPYMGSLESVFASIVFSLVGVSSAALKIVPLFFSVILIPIVYDLAKALGGQRAARYAALLCAVPPSALLVWSSMARGGYIEMVFLGALASLILMHQLQSKSPTLGKTILIAILLGCGWWVNNQIVFFACPIAVFLFLHLCKKYSFFSSKTFLHVMLGSIFFFIGGYPFWDYNLAHEFASFGIMGRASWGEVWTHVCGVFTTALPMILGSKRFWQTTDTFPNATLLLWIFYATIFITILLVRAGAVARLFVFSIDSKRPIEFFLLFLITCVALFSLSSYGWLVEAPRYLLSMYVGVFVLVAWVASSIHHYNPVIAHVIIGGTLFFNISSSYLGGRAIPGEPHIYAGQRVSKDHTELISWLERNNFSWIRTNYWIGYRLAFETNEKVKFLLFQDPYQVRIPNYRDEGEAIGHSRMPMVLVPKQAQMVETALHLMGYSYSKETVSDYVVLFDLSSPETNLEAIALDQLTASSNFHQEAAAFAIDGDAETRWGSGHPQNNTMEFQLEFNQSTPLRGIHYKLGKWAHDYPRKLEVLLDSGINEPCLLFDSPGWAALRYYLEGDGDISLSFETRDVKRVVLRQTGSDPVFDWSIAELSLFR